jgi:hypothetical protein
MSIKFYFNVLLNNRNIEILSYINPNVYFNNNQSYLHNIDAKFRQCIALRKDM